MLETLVVMLCQGLRFIQDLEVVGFSQESPYRLWLRSFASNDGNSVDAVVPYMGESVTDGTIATFLKKPGDRVEVDEPIAQIETDKVTIDVTSPEAGIIQKLIAREGDTVTPGTKVAIISKSDGGSAQVPSDKKVDEPKPSPPTQKEMPKVEASQEKPKATLPPPPKVTTPPAPTAMASEPVLPPKERERRVPMTRLRKRVATRLKDSQNTFAMLTTFNEVDMTNLMKLRSDYKDAFVEKHGVKLGFMSGFVKAAVSALQNQPIVNAVIDGDDIIYREYIDISIAVGTPKRKPPKNSKNVVAIVAFLGKWLGHRKRKVLPGEERKGPTNSKNVVVIVPFLGKWLGHRKRKVLPGKMGEAMQGEEKKGHMNLKNAAVITFLIHGSLLLFLENGLCTF
ncbi:hypothetical protein ACLOJK_019081 [Asimina triloba]